MAAGAGDGLFGVAGRRAVVTGGSRGIGLMIARGLVAAGAQVVISSRKADACGGRGHASCPRRRRLRGDPRRPRRRRKACRRSPPAVARALSGRLDLLVNNAGATWGAPLEEFPDSGWDKILDTNVKAIFRLTVALLPDAARRGQRRGPGPRGQHRVDRRPDACRSLENYSYSASKAAVHMLTRHLAKRLAGESITVNAIAPGPFESKMTAFMLDDPDARAAVEQHVPLGRIGSPEDIVGTTIFLASRAGAYLTGAVIPLDGGIVGCG